MDSLKIAYIIQCHKDVEQINRLVSQLIDINVDVYIHVDKKAKGIRENIKRYPQVTLLSEEEWQKVYWSDISQVKATLRLIEKVFASEKEYDYIWLLSGQDFPIKDKKYIYETLSKNKENAFINISNIPNATKRNEIFYPRWMLRKSVINRGIKRIWITVTGGKKYTYKIFKRKSIFEKYYYGSSWWCLPYNCVLELYQIIQENKNIMKFFSHSVCADECVFQSLIKKSSYKDKISNYLTYVDWSTGKSFPKILTEVDVEKLKDTHFLFARKFETKVSSKVIDKLEILLFENGKVGFGEEYEATNK